MLQKISRLTFFPNILKAKEYVFNLCLKYGFVIAIVHRIVYPVVYDYILFNSCWFYILRFIYKSWFLQTQTGICCISHGIFSFRHTQFGFRRIRGISIGRGCAWWRIYNAVCAVCVICRLGSVGASNYKISSTASLLLRSSHHHGGLFRIQLFLDGIQ